MSFSRKGGRLRVGGYRGTSWNIVKDTTRSSLGDETSETIYVCQELICLDMIGQRLAIVEMNSIYCLHLVASDAEYGTRLFSPIVTRVLDPCLLANSQCSAQMAMS